MVKWNCDLWYTWNNKWDINKRSKFCKNNYSQICARENEKHIPQCKQKSKVAWFPPLLAHAQVRNGLIKEGINSLLSSVWLNALSSPANPARNRIYLHPPWVLPSKPVWQVVSSGFLGAYFSSVSIVAELRSDTCRIGKVLHCCLRDTDPVGWTPPSIAIFFGFWSKSVFCDLGCIWGENCKQRCGSN